MIEESSDSTQYLTSRDIADIHARLAEQVTRQGDEPLPDFRYVNVSEIDALVAAPQQKFFGREAYPTLAEKAAIIFYTTNRRHIFPNGNKRMSTLLLVTFLIVNRFTLDVSSTELTEKALWLANADALEFPAVKEQLTAWIEEHLVPLE